MAQRYDREEQVEARGGREWRMTPEHRVDQPKWQIYSRRNRGAHVKSEVETIGGGSYDWRKDKKEREERVQQVGNQ